MTIKRIVTTLAGILFILIIIATIPQTLYLIGAYSDQGAIPTPEITASMDELNKAWSEHQGCGPYSHIPCESMILDRQSAWSYVFDSFCGRNAESSGEVHDCVYRLNGRMPTYYAALYHTSDESLTGAWGGLRIASLKIWVSRHWSSSQLAQFLHDHQHLKKDLKY